MAQREPPRADKGEEGPAPPTADEASVAALSQRRAPWWEIAAIFVAGAAAGVALWQGCETRQANTEQLKLFRQDLELSRKQFDTSARPIIVPFAEPELVPPNRDNVSVRFRLQNATSAPALGGFVVITPIGPDPGNDEEVRPYPTCKDDVGAFGHEAFATIPPVPAGETVVVEFEVAFDPGTVDVICGTADFADATGERRLTDWIWTRRAPFAFGRPEDLWIPTDIQIVDNQSPNWWFLESG